ncbi:hypothetical protein N9C31_02315 [Gammaproteobacteria bacterium]|nr:hypothetical protein [Gammaproteobacteria bacterium]
MKQKIEQKIESTLKKLLDQRIKFLKDDKPAVRVPETLRNGAPSQNSPAQGVIGKNYRRTHIPANQMVTADQMGSKLTHHKRERNLLAQNTALAILQVAWVKADLSQVAKELAAAQMKKNKGRSDKEEGLTIPEILIKYFPEVGGKKLTSKQAKKLIKRAEGVMMTRLANSEPLYQTEDGKMTVERIAIKEGGAIEKSDVITSSSLLKGELAKGQPPRNLRMLTCQGPLGTKNYYISSYVVAGTDVTGLKALAGDNQVFYSSVVDGKDHFGSRLIDVYKRIKGDSELKLQKEAAKSDKEAAKSDKYKIIRMNTTQKRSRFTANSMSSQVGILLAIAIVAGTGFWVPFIFVGLAAGIGVGIAALVVGVVVRSFGASLKVNPAIYDKAKKVITKLDEITTVDAFNKAYGAKATEENLGTLKKSAKEELTYLKDQLKKVEQGTIKPGNRWKPVFEQMIVARTGGVALMGCKSGKDRAFGITALIMAMEQRVASCVEEGKLTKETLDKIDLAKDQQLAINLKNIYVHDYGSRVGAENCDGAFGTKSPKDFFPKGLWNALDARGQNALEEFCKTSNRNAKLNDGVKEYDKDLTSQTLLGNEGRLVYTNSREMSRGLSDQGSVVISETNSFTGLEGTVGKRLEQDPTASKPGPDDKHREVTSNTPK